MLKQNLQIKLGQKMAPQQIQLMKLIQLHTLEFEEELQRSWKKIRRWKSCGRGQGR